MTNLDQTFASVDGMHDPYAFSDQLIGLVLAVGGATIGGYLCGLAIFEFGEIGSISLWLLGGGLGFLAAKTMSRPRRVVGWMLAISCVLAFALAEVCWISWQQPHGQEGWMAALRYLPRFVQEFQMASLIGGIFTVLGALSAYRQAGIRYRLVQVTDE